MFEKNQNFLVAGGRFRTSESAPLDEGDIGPTIERGGDALRAIEWGELTARLNAARDLRSVLRRDAQFNIEASAASFGDAAARYFQNLGHGERDVNPDGLEARKASSGIIPAHGDEAATGDARDD